MRWENLLNESQYWHLMGAQGLLRYLNCPAVCGFKPQNAAYEAVFAVSWLQGTGKRRLKIGEHDVFGGWHGFS